jgi:hypothetical protein
VFEVSATHSTRTKEKAPMSSTTRYSKDEATEIAATIHRQIAVATFMTLGASNLGYLTSAEHPTFCFVARIIPTGKSAPRKMSVNIEYLPSDLYRVTVWYLDRQVHTITHYEASEVHVEALNSVLFALDREG